ncbi:hypothetical protein PLUTE_a0160 [Pseudoalteromonas luteoviolacea DSM 6061]|nr:hypothetical protein [Pseudoalteromonas luteoviolacea DSM 6061]
MIIKERFSKAILEVKVMQMVGTHRTLNSLVPISKGFNREL